MFGLCTEMCGFGYINVLLCLKNLVYNVFVNVGNAWGKIAKQWEICGVAWVVCPISNVYNAILKGGKKAVLKTDFEIEIIGEPDIKALPESEQHTFLETLLAQLKELKEQQNQD